MDTCKRIARYLRALAKGANLRDQSGASAIEYALIVGLIAAALIGTLGDVGESVKSMFEGVSEAVEAAPVPAPEG